MSHTFRDFSEEQAASVAAEQSPGLVTAHGSFETFCPGSGVSRDHVPSLRPMSSSVRATSRLGQFGSGLSTVLKRVTNAKLEERSIESAGVAPATPLRSDCAIAHTGLAIEPTQLSQQHLTSVLLPHMLHETSVMGVSSQAALRTAKVFPGLPWLLFRRGCLLDPLLAVAELAELLMP